MTIRRKENIMAQAEELSRLVPEGAVLRLPEQTPGLRGRDRLRWAQEWAHC